MNIIIPIFSIIVLVLINIILSYNEKKLYWLYELSHFVGGFILAVLFFNFLDKKSVLFAVLIVGCFWEIYEQIINRNKTIKKFFENKFRYYIIPSTLLDTLLDLSLAVVGAMFYLYLF